MNLFRSEEHVQNWSGFKANTEDGILPLDDIVRLFSVTLFRRRLDPDYSQEQGKYRGEFVETLKEIAKSHPFWSPVSP